jgi:hemerythrin-like domain-containing protein
MDLQLELERYRREHDQILRFLKEWEAALQGAASESDERRCQGLARLCELEPQLAAMVKHCEEEEKTLDSRFQLYLDEQAIEHLRREHAQLRELGRSYTHLLRILTATPPTRSLVDLGQQLVGQLRRHIAYEEGLLKQIEDGSTAQGKAAAQSKQAPE